MIDIRISKQLQFSGGKSALSVGVSLEENSITALYGNSGAGKTTLLKIIAGLITPEKGFIKVNDTVWLDTKNRISLSPQQRSTGFVFQDYALFPNMTVLQNIRYAAGNIRDDAFTDELVNRVSLQSFLHTKPSALSGGQQQRVALVRALVRKPQLLLLDEPLAALDIQLRHDLHQSLQLLQKQLGFSALLVSHNVSEVYSLAKKVIHLQDGKVLFYGLPQQMFGTSNMSNKLQLTGEIISIIPNGVICIVDVLAGTNIIRLTATSEEVKDVKAGDTVLVYAKAFQAGMKKMK